MRKILIIVIGILVVVVGGVNVLGLTERVHRGIAPVFTVEGAAMAASTPSAEVVHRLEVGDGHLVMLTATDPEALFLVLVEPASYQWLPIVTVVPEMAVHCALTVGSCEVRTGGRLIRLGPLGGVRLGGQQIRVLAGEIRHPSIARVEVQDSTNDDYRAAAVSGNYFMTLITDLGDPVSIRVIDDEGTVLGTYRWPSSGCDH